MTTSSPASSMAAAATADSTQLLAKQIRSHEVSIAELSALSSTRTVYQKHGNIFFRTNVQQATTFEQKQLDTAKANLQKLNLAGGN